MISPQFSIVIPTYNREHEVCRAVQSCLDQDYTDFEIVVVDDASSDGTVTVLGQYRDSRFHLVRRPVNGGECPARNTGVEHSRGEWIVFLDSDDALKNHCLTAMRRSIADETDEVSRYGFMYDSDLGVLSPDPPPAGPVLDYEGWMRFQQSARISNCLCCTRRSTFAVVGLPQTSVAPTEYHLDFSRRFRTRLVPKVLATQHTDAPNRLTGGGAPPALERAASRAAHDRESMGRILREHGPALRRHAPRLYELVWRVTVLSCLIRRERRAGLRALAGYIQHARPRFRALAGIAIAAVSPSCFLRLRQIRPRSV